MLWLLISGSFMSSQEMGENLAPILETGKSGYAFWPLLPQYPTFRSYVELLLDSPGFYVMFWNSCLQTGLVLAGKLLGALAFRYYPTVSGDLTAPAALIAQGAFALLCFFPTILNLCEDIKWNSLPSAT